MRAMAMEQVGSLRKRTIDDPEPGDDRVLIDVAVCGVCRTDLQIVSGDLAASKLPIVPGHQVVGRVVGTGERVGVGWLHGTCGRCAYCRSGRENLCPDADFTGWSVDGGYAERLLARRDFIFPIPERFTDLEAAPLLCAGVIGYRSLKLSGIEPGGRLGLFGFGSSAHLAIQVACHWGCEVYVFSRSDAERLRAQRLGAVWSGTYDDPSPAPLDAAVTFAPAGSVVIAALAAVAPGATVAINAIHLDRMPEFGYDLLWKERVLRSVANFTRRDATEFLDIASQVPVRAEVEVFDLDDAEEALRRLAEGRIEGSAVLRV